MSEAPVESPSPEHIHMKKVQNLASFVLDSDPPELRELSSQLGRFAEERLRVAAGEEPQFRRGDFDAMAALGLTGMSIAESLGGTALSSLASAALLFELSRAQLGPAIYLSVHAMVGRILSPFADAHAETLRALASGQALGAFCLTEAQAGSDAAALQTKAVRDGESYTLSGEKIYITSAGAADIYLVFARTGEPGAKGISAFVVPRSAPGISFGAPEKKMGCGGSPIAAVHFDGCRVPASARCGVEGEGYKIALSALSSGRVNIAACACGVASRALELAVSHLQERKQFGKALAEFQGLQFMVADCAMQLRAAILMTREAARELDAGAKSASASMAKCFATDAAMRITTDCVQLLGGAGYLAEYRVEGLMRDAKMLQIVEGTNQIQRMLIARELLER